MQYINPIEILGLSNVVDTTSIDNEIIKKVKRKLFADIDLSDNGLFEYYGLQLTKGECEKVIDDLANNDLKEFYLYLASNKKLNNFLVNGNDAVFINFKQDSIFKLPEFVKFISPYFAPKFDKALLNAFENEDVEQTKSILKTSFLISQNDINLAYKSVSNSIQNRIDDIAEIKRDIKNEESVYDEDDIGEVVDLVVENFPSDILNCLPNYFQSQILKIANEINYLNVVIWDNFDNTQVCNDLLEHVLTLNIGGLDKPTFQKNYEIVRKKNQERIEQEKNAPVLRKYAGYLIQTKTKLKEIEDKTTTPTSLLSWVNSSISISDVNNLPSVFDEIKNQVALSLRAMSVEIWNSFSNIDVSIDLINKANNITGLKSETRDNLQNAKKQLTELKTKIDLANLVRQRVSTQTQTRPVSRPTTKSKEDNSGCLWLVGIAVVIGLIVWANSNKSSSNDYTPATENYSAPATTSDNSYSNNNSKPSTTNEYTTPAESQYKGNQLSNGASPLNGCFGKGKFAGQAYITFDNSNSTDAIVSLVNYNSQKTIRNEYIKAGAEYTMHNIPSGTYYLKVYYGNDWNPTKTNFCGTKGAFESDVHFSKSDNIGDLIEVSNSEYSYTTGRITLYSVPNGNMSTESMSESEFFNQ